MLLTDTSVPQCNPSGAPRKGKGDPEAGTDFKSWDRVNFEKQMIHFDRAIDRVSKKNTDMPKMNILYKFPNLYQGTKTTIVLKQPKSDDTIRDVDVPQSVLNALLVLKEMQDKLAGKMDEFLDGKAISEPQKSEKDEAGSAEQVLQQLMKSNPELLIEFARSVQNANKK